MIPVASNFSLSPHINFRSATQLDLSPQEGIIASQLTILPGNEVRATLVANGLITIFIHVVAMREGIEFT